MVISKQNGDLVFDNVTIRSNMLVDELMKITGVETEFWSSNAGYDMYRIDPLRVNDQIYTATIVFFNTRVDSVTFGPKPDVSSWDDVTDALIQRNGEILKEFMKNEFGVVEGKHSFQWGAVQLSQDAKNAFDYSVTVSYNE